MSFNLLQRAEILVQQRRYSEAGRILENSLSTDPTDVLALSMLAEVNIQLDLYDKADMLTDTAIGLSPDMDGLYLKKARIALCKKKYSDAEKHIGRAIEMNPAEASYYALWSSVKLTRKDYESALDLANNALALEPENLLALNTRSTTLMKLNRPEGAFQAIEGALREDPDNAFTHANYGWNLLENGDHKKALEHFREALKNEPDSEYAQSGMLEALKANNIIYRLFLKYSFWIGKMTSNYQWGVIIGIYFISRTLRTIANQNENLRPFLIPLVIILALAAFSTWVIDPIGNLFLRLNKYGKHLLTGKEKISANFVGICLLIFLVGLSAYLITGITGTLVAAAFGFGMMVPCGSMFEVSKYKYALVVYTALMALTGLAGIAETFRSQDPLNGWCMGFLYGFLAFQWVANFLVIRESNV